MARRSQGGIVNRLPSSDILGQDRVEHLDGDQDRVRDRRGLRLSLREVVSGGAVLAQQIAGRRIWRTGRGQKKNSKIQESRGMIRFGKKKIVFIRLIHSLMGRLDQRLKLRCHTDVVWDVRILIKK